MGTFTLMAELCIVSSQSYLSVGGYIYGFHFILSVETNYERNSRYLIMINIVPLDFENHVEM